MFSFFFLISVSVPLKLLQQLKVLRQFLIHIVEWSPPCIIIVSLCFKVPVRVANSISAELYLKLNIYNTLIKLVYYYIYLHFSPCL